MANAESRVGHVCIRDSSTTSTTLVASTATSQLILGLLSHQPFVAMLKLAFLLK